MPAASSILLLHLSDQTPVALQHFSHAHLASGRLRHSWGVHACVPDGGTARGSEASVAWIVSQKLLHLLGLGLDHWLLVVHEFFHLVLECGLEAIHVVLGSRLSSSGVSVEAGWFSHTSPGVNHWSLGRVLRIPDVFVEVLALHHFAQVRQIDCVSTVRWVEVV